jgi:hypothetical protein
LKNFSSEYLVFAFDSSQFKGIDYFIGIAYIPYKNCLPTLICFEEKVKKQDEIAKTISNTIIEISKISEIINIVVDGLPYQLEAVSLTTQSNKGNIHEYLKNYSITPPFVLPDIPHLVQLAVTHTKDNGSSKLNEFINMIDEVAVEIRKPNVVEIIGARCPCYPKTRFLYIVLTMKFIMKNSDNIIQYYKSNGIDIRPTLLLASSLLKILFPLFTFLTHYESDKEDCSTIYYQLFHLFMYEKDIFDKIENKDIKVIMNRLFIDLYSLTLNSDFGFYYISAYALSISGGEHIRRKNVKYNPISIKTSVNKIDYSNFETLPFHLSFEQKEKENLLDEKNEEEDPDSEDEEEINCEDIEIFEPSKRDINYLQYMKKNEMVLRVRSFINKSDKENNSFNENQENINNQIALICKEIDDFPMQYYTIELMNTIWNKLYPNCPSQTLEDVIKIYCKYWENPEHNSCYSNIIKSASSNISFWKYVKNIGGNYYYAGDYAIRMTCAGVTETGVEREFSYLKWIFGMRRFSLKKNTLINFLRLKNINK